MTIADALAARGIRLRRWGEGEHRAACPRCALDKPRRQDDALAVRIDHDGATWLCHRCGWQGGVRHEGERPAASHRPVEPAEHYTLSPWGHEVWDRARPVTADSPAGRYLTGRCCPLPDPAAVRWVAELRHGPGGRVFPALLGLVTDTLTGEPINLHRTWLAPDGSGKAPVEKPRLLLKGHRKAGGVIRLSPDDAVTMGLAIGEGLETCLSASLGFAPIWCAIDAGNVGAFPVLPGIEALTLFQDHDPAGERAFAAVRDRWLAAGREVRRVLSEVPGEDFNDLARKAAGDARHA